ncbi:SusC/RagA family TonB-linked outer membrane protein [Chitinophaga filiformis]|uniref:SusC/RagA family TonB-linked outer membrane protein n=1 Tax=Chitinophaga filiformis TaxID=104663 RepID=UPI001F3D0BE7|nr:SusC/RagA family TonB-linked outer membrane protein [Chitinophaga filiformis]MCF6401333.1 SusC/RagA family TonB-linked outer membrane protein [Chitinophaga filiformis]
MQKIVKLNRAFLYCCMVVMFCLYSEGYAAPKQGKPVSLTVKNSTLADVLRQVSKKSGLYIYFQDVDLAAHKNVTIDVRDKPVESVLHELLDARGFSWVEVSENTIAVKKKPITEERIEGDTVATITVTGKVVDEKGAPVIGATVVVRNSKIGTITNPNGDFVLNDVKENAWIVISNVSSLSEEVPVRGRATVGEIKLKEKVGELDEIVVIPYGNTTKRLNTGNIASIKADEIEKQPINNPLYALQGRVAGLQITPTTGLAGGSLSLQIRGRNTLRDPGQGNADPLIVIDGLPIVATIRGLGFSGLPDFSALNFINPNEIESIDILKDADATSIYGSRGANGVVLITTKKGKKGNVTTTINAKSGVGIVTKRVELLDRQQYYEIRREAFLNSNRDMTSLPATRTYADLNLWDSTRSTDWQKELIGGTAKYTDLQATATGGSNNTQYLFGGNYHRETTVFPKSNSDQKVNVHFNLTTSTNNNRFKAMFSASYMVDNNTLPGIDFTSRALTLPPSAPKGYNEDGSLNWAPLVSGNSSWDNPYAELLKTYEAKVKNLLSAADISYQILPYLTAKAQVSYNDLSGSSFRRLSPFAAKPPEQASELAVASSNNTTSNNISIEPQLVLQTTHRGLKINGLFGTSFQRSVLSDQSITAYGFESDELLKNFSSASIFELGNNYSEYKYFALFGRVSLNWQNKYLININARRDGSSRFGPGKQYGNFGSLGLAWIFSEENFIKEHLPIMSFGKLRVSYGSSGNDGIGNYQYLERYQAVSGVDIYQGTRGYTTTGLFNPYYQWETTKKLEAALETGFIKDRIIFSVCYFRNRSSNQLLSYPLPSISGPGNFVYNLPALIQNAGIEGTFNTKNIISSKFSWSSSFNITRNNNKLISFPGLENSIFYSSYEIGKPFYGNDRFYKFAGVDPQTGKYQFETNDGKITEDPEDPSRLDGGQYLRIRTIPAFYGGLSNAFTFGRFSLDVFIQFVKQNGVNPVIAYTLPGSQSNLPIEYLSRWRKEGDKTDIQKIYVPGSGTPSEYSRAINFRSQSDEYLTDASFVRLKNISVAYSLSAESLHKLKLKQARIFINAQNVLTLTSYKGLDPETQSRSQLPPLRMVVAGLQITL